MTEQPIVTPTVRAAMQAMLRACTILGRDMARSPRRGFLFLAEMIMEARLVSDHLDGKRSNFKRVIADVVPQLISLRTAMNILREMADEGLIVREQDTKDRRATITIPTAKSLDRAERRWERLAAVSGSNP